MTHDQAIEAAARAIAEADGLDFDEVCGREADPDLDECDSGTCVAAYSEEHDAEDCRGWYLRQARAAAPILMEQGARLALEAAARSVVGYIHPDPDSVPGRLFASAQVRDLDPAEIVKGSGCE